MSGVAAGCLLAGPDLEGKPELLNSVVERLGGSERVRVASRLTAAIWRGPSRPVHPSMSSAWINSCDVSDRARELIVIEGILHRPLRGWRGATRPRTSRRRCWTAKRFIKAALGPRDLLVIESRAYHADHASLVRLFDRMRSRTGCQMNLDLQRLAIPTGCGFPAGP